MYSMSTFLRVCRPSSCRTMLQVSQVHCFEQFMICLLRSENPWIAAQRFLNKNELPETYADQVVEFIEKNTAGVKLGTGEVSSTYVDPYTGASRYTGASSSTGPSVGADPFTGALNFLVPSLLTKLTIKAGSSAYSSTPAAPPRSKGVLPVKVYLSFKQFNVNAAKSKIAQLNEEVKASSVGS